MDILGFASHGLLGINDSDSYTGSWNGKWSISSDQAVVHISGQNITSASSMSRVPIPSSWSYNSQLNSLQEHIFSSDQKVFQSPIKDLQFNGWTSLPTVELQSPVVPFISFLKDNPLGNSGPLRSVNQYYDFDLERSGGSSGN